MYIETLLVMHKFHNAIDKLLLEEDTNVNRIGIFPGAFKPPHVGHYTTALNACKNNDSVYIYVSTKSRPIPDVHGESAPTGDIARFSNLLNGKRGGNLLGVQPAEVARMTSATAFRAAVSIKDKVTVSKNLPEGAPVDQIFEILMESTRIGSDNYGNISIGQTMRIWEIYRDMLIQSTNIQPNNLNITQSPMSPVRDTYDLVDEINETPNAGNTSVHLYVGT